MSAPKQVAGGRPIPRQGLQPMVAPVLPFQGFQCLWMTQKLLVADRAEESGRIVTVRHPLFLLPTGESGSPPCDLIDNVRIEARQRVRVSELGVVSRGKRA